jgi:NAD(P)-dependent dehydrogenase (short-subunit alcohol dehydrogenase family)
MGRLDGKVAIVTGSGTGIGRAGATLFAKEGAEVVVADVDPKGGEETARIIREAGGESIFVKTDMTEAAEVEKMVKATIDAYGKLDVLWNNAGVSGECVYLTEYKEEEWDRIVNINLKGVWLGMKYAIPQMLKNRRGSIVNSASLVATEGFLGFAGYSAAKGGVIALTRVAAAECVEHNIRVNWVVPNYILTPMVKAFLEGNPALKKQAKAAIPMHRMGEPKEVAQAALFLASDESSYTTGTGIFVDGGVTGISYMPNMMKV